MALTEKLGGAVVDISATSKNHINPFDISLKSYEKGDDPVAVKSQFILSVCEAAIGEISAGEKSVIDRCVKKYMINTFLILFRRICLFLKICTTN